MHSVPQDVKELQKQLAKGSIQRAYRALLAYMMRLRTRFASQHGDSAVSGLYQGYLDMTYFALCPPSLKSRDLKVAIVFNYDAFRFEVWLAARNRKVQRQYWELCKEGCWPGCRVVAPAEGVDAIVECDLTQDFDFSDLDALTSRIEGATAAFITRIERFLSDHAPRAEGNRRQRC